MQPLTVSNSLQKWRGAYCPSTHLAMARWFKVTNTSRHCGQPITVACIVIALFTAGCQAFSLYFLPLGAAIPFMIIACAIGIVGVVSSLTGFRWLTNLYLIAVILLGIPILVVIGFVIYTLTPRHIRQWAAGVVLAFFSMGFLGSSLQAFRKLRLFQAGVHTVVQEAGRRHHHGLPDVATAQTVYTASNVTSQAFMGQQTPAAYPMQNTAVTTTPQQFQPPPAAYTMQNTGINPVPQQFAGHPGSYPIQHTGVNPTSQPFVGQHAQYPMQNPPATQFAAQQPFAPYAGQSNVATTSQTFVTNQTSDAYHMQNMVATVTPQAFAGQQVPADYPTMSAPPVYDTANRIGTVDNSDPTASNKP